MEVNETVAKRFSEIWVQDKHFSQAFEIKANMCKTECLCLQNRLVFRDSEGLLTHQIQLESMQRGTCLPLWTGPQSCSSFLPGIAGRQHKHPSSEAECQRDGLVAGNFYAMSWNFHFQTRFFQTSQKCLVLQMEGYGLQEAECWPCSFAGRWFPWPSFDSSRSSSQRSGCWSPGGMCSRTISPLPCWWSVCLGARYR